MNWQDLEAGLLAAISVALMYCGIFCLVYFDLDRACRNRLWRRLGIRGRVLAGCGMIGVAIVATLRAASLVV